MKKLFFIACFAVTCFAVTGCGKKQVEEHVVAESPSEEQPQAATLDADFEKEEIYDLEENDSEYSLDDIINSIPTNNVEFMMTYSDMMLATQMNSGIQRSYIDNKQANTTFDMYVTGNDIYAILNQGGTEYLYKSTQDSYVDLSGNLMFFDNIKSYKSIHYVDTIDINGVKCDVLDIQAYMKTQADYMTLEGEVPEGFEESEPEVLEFVLYMNEKTKKCVRLKGLYAELDNYDADGDYVVYIKPVDSLVIPEVFLNNDDVEVVTPEQVAILMYSAAVATDSSSDGGIIDE